MKTTTKQKEQTCALCGHTGDDVSKQLNKDNELESQCDNVEDCLVRKFEKRITVTCKCGRKYSYPEGGYGGYYIPKTCGSFDCEHRYHHPKGD